MDKKDSAEIVSPVSPAVTVSAVAEREKDAPRKWIAAYLSGMDEDDFRKRYFKSISRDGFSQPQLVKKNSSQLSISSMSTQELVRTSNQPFADRETGEPCTVEEEDANDRKTESSKNHEAIVVSRTDDVLKRWTKRTEDDCRLWYIKTLMMKKIFNAAPIKEQKSNRGVTLVIIFDWDDTLLCTTFLGKMAGLVDNAISEKDRQILAKTDETAVPNILPSANYLKSPSNTATLSSSPTQRKVGLSTAANC